MGPSPPKATALVDSQGCSERSSDFVTGNRGSKQPRRQKRENQTSVGALRFLSVLIDSHVPMNSGLQSRRGTRIPCEIPARLIGLNPERAFSASCLVVLINPYGCAARFPHRVDIGSDVRLEGLPMEASARARVISCISFGASEKFCLLGLSLNEPGNVWGVEKPPEDWNR
jgi:hypothetical protein